MAEGVTQSYITSMALSRNLGPGGKHGVASGESRDPIGFAVAALNRMAQSELLDRVGLRKQAEQAVFTVTRSGFRSATAARPSVHQRRVEPVRRRPGPRRHPARGLRPDAHR